MSKSGRIAVQENHELFRSVQLYVLPYWKIPIHMQGNFFYLPSDTLRGIFLNSFITWQFRIFSMLAFIWRQWSKCLQPLFWEPHGDVVYLTGLNVLMKSLENTKNEGNGKISSSHRIPFTLWLGLTFSAEAPIILKVTFLMQSE